MKRLLQCMLLLCFCAGAQAEVAVPPLKARVTDLTGTLSADERAALEKGLQAFEARNGSQIAVLLVPTTQPETIEQYSIRVVEAWKLGRKGTDNGLLLLVAKDDRKVRIEVGYGLEGVIPDVVAHRVIDETIKPRFKEGEYMRGLVSGLFRLEALIGERSQAPSATGMGSGSDETSNEADQTWTQPVGSFPENQSIPQIDKIASTLSELPMWLIIALIVVGTALRWFMGPLPGGLTMGAVVGSGAWFVFRAIDVAIYAGLAALVFVLVGVLNWTQLLLSGSSGGSSGSGGGFSGGGGGFGGGGASGGW